MAVIAEAQITLSVMRDIKAVYWFYLLQGVNVSAPQPPSVFPPPSPWDDAEPDYDEGSTDRLYFVECTVFCDDTFDYSEVSLSSSYEAAKNAWNKANTALKNTITGVDVMYANHTSSTSAPTTGWSTTAPAWVDGKYMWQKTVTTFGDGETIESDPTCISGAKGSTGSAGKGISSVKEQYYRSTSATTQTGGSWSDTYPGWQDGTYIWTRTVISYTTGNPLTTTPICVTGSKGETGAQGATGAQGVRGTGIYKVTTAPSGYTTATGGFTPTYRMSLSTAKSQSGASEILVGDNIRYSYYLYPVGYVDSSYVYMGARTSIRGSTGSQGATGDPGTSVESIEVQYYLSTSKTTQTGGSWSSTMPSWSSGTYLWIRHKITYANPASTEYTNPQCDSSWEAMYEAKTEIDQTINSVSIKYYDSAGNETTFKLSNGALDLSFLKGQIDDAEKTATNFISLRSDGGIEVGNKSGGSWTGYRSQILAGEFNVLDANGTKLSSFGATDVHLGMNSTGSVIHFCGDKATISYNNGDLFFKGEGDGTSTVYLGMYKSGDYGPGLYMRSEYKTVASADWDYSEIVVEHPYIGIRAGQLIDLLADTVNVSGRIRGTTQGVSWHRGRTHATLIATGGTGTSAYFPVIDTKCNEGDWSIGTLGSSLYFVYTSDANHNSDTNATTRITIDSGGSITADGNIGCGSMFLRAWGAYHIRFADDTEAIVAYPHYESSGYKAMMLGHDSSSINTIVHGNNIQFRSNTSSIDFMPYYGKTQNPSYWYITVGVVNTSYGPCIRPFSNGYCTVGGNGYGFKYYYGTNTGIQSTSDIRLKENISDDFSNLEKLFEMLRPVTYEYKHLEDDNDVRIGFIAQDVWSALESCGYDPRRFAAIHTEEVDPESDLKKYIDTDETYYLNYTEFTALNTYMIQKLMKENEVLRSDIIFCKKEIAGLKTAIVDFQKVVENLNKEISILKGVA